MEPPHPEPIGPISSSTALRSLLIALLTLLLAALAVVLFAIVSSAVSCVYQPVTYAVFTAIVLAILGSILGGQAAIRGAFETLGLDAKWTVGGGAGLLVIIAIGVWFATRTSCTAENATLRLTAIPSEYAVAGPNASQPRLHLRIRFDDNLKVRQFFHNGLGFDVFFVPEEDPVSIFVDLVYQNKVAQICEILISPLPSRLRGKLDDVQDLIPLERTGNAFDLGFRQDFLDQVLKQYKFEGRYPGGNYDCIQANFYDDEDHSIKPGLVTKIYFDKPSTWKRVRDVPSSGDFSALISPFRLYAIKAPVPPPAAVGTAADKKPEEPAAPSPIETTQRPDQPGASCVVNRSSSRVAAVLQSIIDTGIIDKEDLKVLFEGWCEVEQQFYTQLRSTRDPAVRYRLIHFVRSSITAIDICWSSSDTYREKNPDRCSGPKLNEPRNFARALPFVSSVDQKQDILNLLRENDFPATQEVEALLRAYPHNDFDGLFNGFLKTIDSEPVSIRQEFAQAAVGYYYNRIVENQWAGSLDKIQGIVGRDLSRGSQWADKLSNPDQAVARARLHYGRAHVYLKIASSSTGAITEDFSFLLSLSPDGLASYPYPYHVARALSFNRGNPEDRDRLAAVSSKLERQVGTKSAKFDAAKYNRSLLVTPNAASTEIKKLSPNDDTRVIMTFDANPSKKDSEAWDFIITGSNVGWLKRISKTS